MSGELKPCPFCGGTDIRWFSGSNFVGCFGCMARTATDTTDTAKQDCIAAWNTRATPAPDKLDAATIERVRQALLVFAACARDIRADEPDDDYAKFRLLASDYRRARKLFVDLFGEEPPFPEDAHAALATDPHQHGGKGA